MTTVKLIAVIAAITVAEYVVGLMLAFELMIFLTLPALPALLVFLRHRSFVCRLADGTIDQMLWCWFGNSLA